MSDVKGKSTSDGVVKLRDKQKRFVEEYLVDLNGKQAAIRAGYTATKPTACRAMYCRKSLMQITIILMRCAMH